MPDIRLTNVPWPSGTAVGAYTRTIATLADPSKLPPGAAAQTSNVASDGSLSYSIPAGQYFAVAVLSGSYRYVGFTVSDQPASSSPYGCTTISPYTSLANAIFPTTNRGCFFRVMGSQSNVTALRLTVAVASGNVCLAVYRNNGLNGKLAAPEGGPIASTGSIACPAVGTQDVALGSTVDIRDGDWIYMGADNTTASFLRFSSAQVDNSQLQAYCRARANAFPAPVLPPGDPNATFGTNWTASIVAV